MDTDVEEMQYLGVRGILKESVVLLLHHGRLLMCLGLILVLPLSFVILGHTLFTDPLVARIQSNEEVYTAEVSEGHGSDAARTKAVLYSEFARLGAMLLIYLAFLLTFSLLSTAAIVYSVACIYVEKSVALPKILGVVPRVWKRLMVTFLWVFLIMFVYHVTTVFSVAILLLLFGSVVAVLLPMLLLLAIAFLAIQVYLSLVWHLASVITVLEEHYGIAALRKSTQLVKGKRAVGSILILIYMSWTGVIVASFQAKVVNAPRSSSLSRVVLGVLLVTLLTMVNLLGMLVQSLFYFCVKSYHHQSIDRVVLSDHLEAYLGEYVALKDSAVQLETLEP